MVGGGLKNRAEVDRGDPQVLEVIQAFDHADQITAFETMDCRRMIPTFQVAGLRHCVAASKAIGKDLVENRALDPVGRLH